MYTKPSTQMRLALMHLTDLEPILPVLAWLVLIEFDRRPFGGLSRSSAR